MFSVASVTFTGKTPSKLPSTDIFYSKKESICLPRRRLSVKRMAKVVVSSAFSHQSNTISHRNSHILLAGFWKVWFCLSCAAQHFREMLKYP